jgi:hypothetical protein
MNAAPHMTINNGSLTLVQVWVKRRDQYFSTRAQAKPNHNFHPYMRASQW